MNIRHKIWLERDGKVIFGRGREEIFRAIEECQSLHAAAKKLKMSYRAAWGRVKASEDRLGIKLVETEGAGRRMHLTSEARALLDQFDQVEKEMNDFLRQKAKTFGWDQEAKASERKKNRS